MRRSIPPITITPGQLPGQVQPFVPGGGGLFKAVLSWGQRGGANQKIASCIWFIKHNGKAPLAGHKEIFCRKADRDCFGLAGTKQSF